MITAFTALTAQTDLSKNARPADLTRDHRADDHWHLVLGEAAAVSPSSPDWRRSSDTASDATSAIPIAYS